MKSRPAAVGAAPVRCRKSDFALSSFVSWGVCAAPIVSALLGFADSPVAVVLRVRAGGV